MGLDINKLMKKASDDLAQKKPELFDNKQSVTANQSNSSVKTENIQDKAKTDAYVKNSVWNTKYQPIIDKMGVDKDINYSNSLHMMKAINGRYDNLLKSDQISEEARETIKTLKNSSIATMDEVEKLSKGKGDPKLYTKYRTNADKAELTLRMQLGENTNSNYVYNPDTKLILDRETYKVRNQGVNREIDENGDYKHTTTTNAGGGGTNPFAGYNQMKDYNERSLNQVKDQVKPLVSAWAKNTINLFNADDKTAGRYDSENRQKTLAFAKDALTFASKYGTQSGNPEWDKQNKTKAAKLLQGLNNKDLDYNEMLDYLKKNTNGKTKGEKNFITDLVEDMGYYGSNYLYKKHKGTLGKNDKYYEGAEKYWGNLDKIDNDISAHEKYMEDTKKDKIEARKEAAAMYNIDATDSDPGAWTEFTDRIGFTDSKKAGRHQNYVSQLKLKAFEAAIGEDGQIKDYPEFIKNLSADYKIQSGLMGDRKIQTRQDYTEALYSNTRSFGDDQYNSLFYDDEDFNKVMRQNYNDVVKAYKKKFSDLNDPKKRNKDMGSGDIASSVLSHDYVDMKLDKNNNMINTIDYKNNNVAKVFNMMKTPENGINNTNVTLIGNTSLNNGEFSKASKKGLEVQRSQNKKLFNEFFVGQDLSKMKMVFDRNSSIENHATYTFINQKTGKKLAMIAPADYVEKNNETFWKETTMTVPEARFQKAGSLELPDRDGLYKDAAIIQKKGMKYAVFKYTDDDGVTKQEELEIGSVQIESAKKQFKEYFDRLEILKKQNANFND